MTYKVRYSPRAESDLLLIADGMSAYSVSAPKAFLKRVRGLAAPLKKTPEMYEVFHARPRYRRFVVGRYIAYYTIDDEQKVVTIQRIIHGMREVEKELDR